jgi:hypothetical protein
MELRPNSAKVVDLATNFDQAPMDTPIGPILWATVRIAYTLAGLAPTVDIRVPIPFEASETETERRAQALRSARLLIDHACRAAGIVPEETSGDPVDALIADVVPSALEGVSQELGISEPTAGPKWARRSKG